MARGDGLRVFLEPIPGQSARGILDTAGLLFQCPPLDEFSVDYAHSHTDYETLDNQHSKKGVPQLRTASFSTLVVDYGLYVVNDDAPEIEVVTDTLLKLTEAGDPFLLTVAHALPPRGYANWSLTLAGPELQMPATLRTLKVTEKAGEGDARYLDVAFSEYRDPVQSRSALGKRRAGGRSFPTTARLFADGTCRDEAGNAIGAPPQRPVTLYELARYFYGDSGAAADIQRANGLGSWGRSDALILAPRYKRLGGRTPAKIAIPKPRGVYAVKSTPQVTTGSAVR